MLPGSSGCEAAEPGDSPLAAGAAGTWLSLSAAPRVGDAPLTVGLEARLEGRVTAFTDCPSLAWDFGDGEVLLARTDDCEQGAPGGPFRVEHTYRAAGRFEATVRMLAADVAPSAAVQVIVSGPTPTAAAVAARPGPTIVIATPAGRPGPATISTGMVGSAAGAPPVEIASGTAAPPPATAATPPATVRAAAPDETARPDEPASAVVAAGILPADLYYIDALGGGLWRIPASGAAPEPVAEVGAGLSAYALSPTGDVAYALDGALTVASVDGPPWLVVAAGASVPLWSADGRRLAYAADGVWLFDTAHGVAEAVAAGGAPLAWSGDGATLVVRAADGGPLVVDVATGLVLRVPLAPVTSGGWVPGLPVAWLAGAGLHLLTVADPPTLGRVLEETAAVAAATVTDDQRLVALADRGDGMRAYEVDLTAPMLTPRAVGPLLQLPLGTGFAWAPDGRNVAVANADGLSLLDTATGARVPLVRRQARQPRWSPLPR